MKIYVIQNTRQTNDLKLQKIFASRRESFVEAMFCLFTIEIVVCDILSIHVRFDLSNRTFLAAKVII